MCRRHPRPHGPASEPVSGSTATSPSKHDVAIPMSHLQMDKGKFVLPGATKEVLKALPQFAYAK